MNGVGSTLPISLGGGSPLGHDLLASASSLRSEQSDFSRILSMSGVAPGTSADKPGSAAEAAQAADRKARDTAEKLVAVVLVQPILKQVRESNQAAPPFQPTRGEQQFRSMLDAKLAQEITQSARFPLVERLARDMRQSLRTDAQPEFAATG